MSVDPRTPSLGQPPIDGAGRDAAADLWPVGHADYRSFFETAAIGVCITDVTGRIVDSNPAFRRLVNYDPEQLYGLTFTDLTHPDDVAPERSLFADLVAGRRERYTLQKRCRRGGGGLVWARLSVSLIRDKAGGPRLTFGIAEDITEQRRAEEALLQSHSILRAVTEGATDAVFVKNQSGHYLMINPAGARFLGKTVAEVIGKDDTELFSPESAQAIMENDRRVLSSGEMQTLEDVGTAAGVTRVYLSTKGPYRDAEGHVIGLVGISRDITERTLADEALRNSEALYHSLVESLPLSIYRKDCAGRYTFGNRRFWEALGRPALEVLGKTDRELQAGEQADRARHGDRRVLKTREVFEDVEEHVRPDGRKLYVHVLKTPVYDFKGELVGTQGIFWDITTRKQTEETLKRTAGELARSYQQLRQLATDLEKVAASERQAHDKLKKAQSQLVQSEKLAALGQMVAGVAHEINNPLAFVINNVAVLQRDAKALREILSLYEGAETDPGRRDELLRQVRVHAEKIDLAYTLGNLDGLVQRTRDGLKRIQQIVKDLRDFARLDESDLKEVDLNEGVRSTLNIVRGRALKQDVDLEVDLAPLPRVVCYPAKVNQVVMNLVANAIDACPGGGKVTVRTRPGVDEIELHISDTGHGIPPEIRDKIFDPFFTTKPPGQGTGLGLSISYGIVEDHGGRIEMTSSPEDGTHFIVSLPLRPPAAPLAGGG